jgi:hypothetical protein
MPSFLLLPEIKYFKHSIPIIYKTQKEINIVSKLFLNIIIDLRKHHFIYWHTTIHYIYNNGKFLKIQSCLL